MPTARTDEASTFAWGGYSSQMTSPKHPLSIRKVSCATHDRSPDTLHSCRIEEPTAGRFAAPDDPSSARDSTLGSSSSITPSAAEHGRNRDRSQSGDADAPSVALTAHPTDRRARRDADTHKDPTNQYFDSLFVAGTRQPSTSVRATNPAPHRARLLGRCRRVARRRLGIHQRREYYQVTLACQPRNPAVPGGKTPSADD
jgi:hypothetical protein